MSEPATQVVSAEATISLTESRVRVRCKYPPALRFQLPTSSLLQNWCWQTRFGLKRGTLQSGLVSSELPSWKQQRNRQSLRSLVAARSGSGRNWRPRRGQMRGWKNGCIIWWSSWPKGLGRSIPWACQDWAATQAAYRFFSNGRVGEEQIMAGHFQATRERPGCGLEPVLVVHDTTEFSYRRKDTAAVGVVSKRLAGKDNHGKPVYCTTWHNS